MTILYFCLEVVIFVSRGYNKETKQAACDDIMESN